MACRGWVVRAAIKSVKAARRLAASLMYEVLVLIAVLIWFGSALVAGLLAGKQALSISIVVILLLLGPLGLMFVINLRN